MQPDIRYRSIKKCAAFQLALRTPVRTHPHTPKCQHTILQQIDVEAVSKEGLTPLMYAAWGCAPNAMKVRLAIGFDAGSLLMNWEGATRGHASADSRKGRETGGVAKA